MVSKMEQFQNSLRGTLNWFLDIRSSLIDQEGAHRAPAIASHICAGYRVLDIPANTVTPINITLTPFDRDQYLTDDTEFRKPIADLYDFANSELYEHISHLVLLGSLVTEDYSCGWSDIDTFMVVKQTTLTDPKKLNHLRDLCYQAWPLFLQITPLQHHGFIVVAEADLSSYPTSCMPPAVFQKSKSLLKASTNITLCPLPGETGTLRSLKERAKAVRSGLVTGELRHHPYSGRYLKAGYKNAHDAMFQLFCMLGYVMTTPAYLMDGLGKGCYKGDSFSIARPFYSAKAWEVIEKASKIRSLWQEKEGANYRLNAIPLWVQEILGDYYFEEWLLLLEETISIIETHKDS